MPVGMSTKDYRVYVRYSQFGFELTAPLFLGAGVDWFFRTSPWGVCIGAVLSLVYMIYRLIGLSQLDESKADPAPASPERR